MSSFLSIGIGITAVLLLAGPTSAEPVSAPSVVRAEAEATVSSIIAGTILALPFEEGQAFREGEVLAIIDCAQLEAEKAVLRAEYEAARSRSDSLERLFARGGAGRAEVASAQALTRAAAAKEQSSDVRLKGCTIKAPFDGRIADYMINAYEYVEPSQPLFKIVSSGKPELEVIAPDDWLLWIRPGYSGRVRLDATAGVFDISVTGISPVVDPVSRTVKLSATFSDEASGVLPGMAGLAQFEARR